ncbi:YdcF family protein [Blastococcus sp. TF02A-30]|uniref:YdcF family protein n=1 Tax=Blastococcus sp. TF02A-30 TaxID=2250580 RepID=UPI001314C5A4|nr:YdcF family protein [Blastococcus sp. TF02A-30]
MLRRRRTWVAAAAGGAVLVTGAALHYLVFPSSDPGLPADAVVVLAGDPEVRLPVALQLAGAGPGLLVVSAADGEVNAPARALCEAPPRDVVVLCFEPEAPQSTRTEAQAIGELVEERGWTHVTVVTSTFHMARADLLVGRCTDAEVAVVEARPRLSGVQWARQVAAEVGGLGGALFSDPC